MSQRYEDLEDLRLHILKIGSEERETQGGWTLGQIYYHLAAAFEASVEGLPPGYHRMVRLILRPMKSFVIKVRFPPWLPIPQSIAFKLAPPAKVCCSEQYDRLLAAIVAFEKHHESHPPHPVLGSLTKQEWIGFHLRHSQHHLGFVKVEK